MTQWSWLRHIGVGARACGRALGLPFTHDIDPGAVSREWLQQHDADSAKRQTWL
jgi:hypothetical protein